MISDILATNVFRLAKVTFVHPEGQKCEVIFLDNGDFGRDVQVLSPYAGTDFGFTTGIPAPEQEGHEENVRTDPDKRDIIAAVALIKGRYYIIGYVFPQITHMAFTKDDPGRLIERHTSDTYRTVNSKGDMDIVHPSGAHIRLGSGSEPDTLAGRDFDGRWSIKHNKGGEPALTLSVDNGQTTVVVKNEGVDVKTVKDVKIDAAKAVSVKGAMDVSLDAGANVIVASGSNVTVASGANVVFESAGALNITAGGGINIG